MVQFSPKAVQTAIQPIIRQPNQQPVNAPRLVDFSGGSMLGSGPYGGQTLEALQARQEELAGLSGDFLKGPTPSPFQGAAFLVNKLGNTMREGMVGNAEAAQRQALIDLMTGVDPVKGATQQQIGQAYGISTDLGNQLVEQAANIAGQEHWFDIPTPEGETGQWQQNSQTGEKMKRGGAGAGVNVTVNPPSAEMGGKIGLANGFLDNYDAILASAGAGEMTGTNWLSAVQFGRGNGGAMYRNLLQGTEGLVRIMTGAGVSEGEARSRVAQYEPAFTDDVPTLVSKIQGLKQAIDNVIEGVETRGDPTKRQPDGKEPPKETPPPETTDTEAAPEQPAAEQPASNDGVPTLDPYKNGADWEVYDKMPNGAKYRLASDPPGAEPHVKGSK